MKMTVERLGKNRKKVVFVGDLDIEGASKVNLDFSAVAGSTKTVLIDLSGVDQIASLGLRALMTGARTVTRRGGTVIALNPQPSVEKVLRGSGADRIIPIFNGSETAIAAL